jgi:hypothetical protein
VKGFTDWLAATGPSQLIQHNEAWFVPTVQSAHIAGIGVALACVLMMTLRVLGYAGMDQSMGQTVERFGPWLKGALWLLLGTGLLMVIGEPERELITFSFWAKMALVVLGTAVVFGFARLLELRGAAFELWLNGHAWVKGAAVASFLVWLAIVFLGRLIAYDHVWGALSPATKA